MPKIWRIENIHGQGPYVNDHPLNSFIRKELSSHTRINGRPNPYFDIGIERNADKIEICGFISKEKALEWFDNELLNELKNYGFELIEIEVFQITAVGEYQVLAIRNHPYGYKIKSEYFAVCS